MPKKNYKPTKGGYSAKRSDGVATKSHERQGVKNNSRSGRATGLKLSKAGRIAPPNSKSAQRKLK
jgi:hypothetical protein